MYINKHTFFSRSFLGVLFCALTSFSTAALAQSGIAIPIDDCVLVSSDERTSVSCELWPASPSVVNAVSVSGQTEISEQSFTVSEQGSSIAFVTSLASLSDNQLGALRQALKVQLASISDMPVGLYQFGQSLELLSPLGGSAQMASRGVNAIVNKPVQDNSEHLVQLLTVMENQSTQNNVIILLSDQIELEANHFETWIETHGDKVRLVFVQLAVSEFLSNQFSTVTNLASLTGGYDVLASESEWLTAIANAVAMSGKSLRFSFYIGQTCGLHTVAVNIATERDEYNRVLNLQLGDCPVAPPQIESPEIATPAQDNDVEVLDADITNGDATAENNDESEDLSNDQPLVPELDVNDEAPVPPSSELDSPEIDSAEVVAESPETGDENTSNTLESDTEVESNEVNPDVSGESSEILESDLETPANEEEIRPEPEESNNLVVFVAVGGLVVLLALIVMVTRRKRVNVPSVDNTSSAVDVGGAIPKALLLIKDSSVVEQPITGELTFIGRLDTNNIVLQNDTVSSKHCVIKVIDRQFIIVDLSSTNGTRVNGQQVDETILSNGDIVELGEVEINVVIGGENA
ncbi:FHA domain-containing protein [Alteromonas sp. KUL49]|uniref:FHA domain-containing protein n=1 Tax=Alteromonas sp. KUL49 TaxID=2480798 RepID=UPI00102EDFED|nr:FHA domain-containing protein [Alteromonas sp. KUL49]TAP40389.1 FHA domain-containing protein [Alteromonas sp. KUL49]GEA11547.1 hypothetical protein KUL49_19220 [Alteromonas sp. KUL49]